MIYQGGIILIGAGIIQFLEGLKCIRLSGITKYYPMGVIIFNLVAFLTIAFLFHPKLLLLALPQLIVFMIIILLMISELRRFEVNSSS
ncbi:MAG: hypothetical protein JXB60_07480 [Candidatus Cloacimonetes bacterium]|nr:hypothetical protein [Candidatus Cloacimonadota bacterium]